MNEEFIKAINELQETRCRYANAISNIKSRIADLNEILADDDIPERLRVKSDIQLKTLKQVMREFGEQY